MVDGVAGDLLMGVAGNLASAIVQTAAQPMEDTLVGKALSKIGLLKPSFNSQIERALSDATLTFLEENPAYHLSEVYSFLSSKTVARDFAAFILDGRSIDIEKMSDKLASYFGLPNDPPSDRWPNSIVPQTLIRALIKEMDRALAKSSDGALIWLSRQVSEQAAVLESIDSKITNLSAEVRVELDESMTRRKAAKRTEFEERYIDHIVSRFQKVTTPGARELHGLHQSLSIAYISLNIKAGAGADPIRAEKFLAQNPLVAIRGPAGSGKTTLLNWMITRCKGNRPDSQWSDLVPFFVPLRKVARLDSGAPSISRLVEYSVDEKIWTVDTPKGWVDQILKREKRGIIMIDGVDELPGSRRSDFWAWVAAIVDEYPGNRIIVTSRALPGASGEGATTEQWNPPTGFLDAQLQDMSDADVTQFVRHWHDAVDSSKLDEQELNSLQEAKRVLPIKLEDAANRRIRELCNTPLLCAMVCVLHWREEGYLPKHRVDLYDACCDMLIEARDFKRGVSPPPGPLAALSKNDKAMVLQRLAIEMMFNRLDGETSPDDSYRIEISREKALAWIKPKISSFQAAQAREASAQEVLDFLIERTGLLREPATDLIDFPHRTFQEYLAACAAGADSQEDMLSKQADDDQWHETIMLAAGTTTGGVGFGRNLIDALIRRGERHKSMRPRQQRIRKTCFALALGCLENLKQQDPELRERVLSNLGELVPPRNDGDARILSVAGDAAVGYLAYNQWKDENTETVAACARSLRLIATTEAIKAIEKGYLHDRRDLVVSEVCRTGTFKYNSIPLIQQYVKENGNLPRYAYEQDVGLFSDLPNLTTLHIDAGDVRNLSDIEKSSELISLTLERVTDATTEIHLLPPSIVSVTLVNSSVGDYSWIDRLINLKSFSLIAGREVNDFGFLDHGSRIEQLNLVAQVCPKLGRMAKLSALNRLCLVEMRALDDVSELQFARQLEELEIRGCPKLEDISSIGSMECLQKLVLEGAGARRRGQSLT